VESTECAGEHDRHNQDTCAEDEHMPGVAQIEPPDPTDEQVANDQVEEAPGPPLTRTLPYQALPVLHAISGFVSLA
jgi:hypothetical protein